jgi:hypothetical protein
MLDRFQKMEEKFEDVAHESCPPTCGPIILKFNKKQQSLKIIKFVMIS